MELEIVLAYEFVEFVPEELKEQTLYISPTYSTAVHKCCCGCGREVVTPLSPTAWQLTFDGKTISLYPSVGSWSLPCQSHYFITKNKVIWSPKWTKKQIAKGRAKEARAKEARAKEGYYSKAQLPRAAAENTTASTAATSKSKSSMWQKIKKWFS